MNKIINDTFSIIPHKILFNNKINSSEKLLYCYIVSLSNKDTYTFATNKYFADKFNVTTRCVNLWLNKLEEEKLIKLEYEYINNEMVKRKIFLVSIK